MDVLHLLLREFPLPANVQQALASENPSLAHNPDLDPRAWSILYREGRCDAATAHALAGRHLDSERLAVILGDHRDPVSAAAVRAFIGSDAELLAALAQRRRRLGPRTAAAVVARIREHPASALLAGADRAWFEVLRPGVAASARADALRACPPAGAERRWSKELRSVWTAGTTIDEELCNLAAGGSFGRDALAAAAASPRLVGLDQQSALRDALGTDRWIALSLAANPYLDPAVAVQLEDLGRSLRDADLVRAAMVRARSLPVVDPAERVTGEHLQSLLRRCLPNQYRGGRIWLAVVLSANPHLDGSQRHALGEFLAGQDVHPFVAGHLRAACERLGGRSTAAPEQCDRAEVPDLELSRYRVHDWSTPATDRALAKSLCTQLGSDADLWSRLYDLAPEFNGSWSQLVTLVRALT
jgi:hypothetical protein